MSLGNSLMYTATHQVLYHYLVTRLGCQKAEASLTMAKTICNNIIKESEVLHGRVLNMLTERDMMDHCLIDLWLEQVAFCGGLLDIPAFLKTSWLVTMFHVSENENDCVVKYVLNWSEIDPIPISFPRSTHACTHNETMMVQTSMQFLLMKQIHEDGKSIKRINKRSDVPDAPGWL